MEKGNGKVPTLREAITDWSIGGFGGTALGYAIMTREFAKADVIAGYGAKTYAIITASLLIGSVFFSVLGGMRLLKIVIELWQKIKLSTSTTQNDKLL